MSYPVITGQCLPHAGQNIPAREIIADALRRATAASRSPAKTLARRIGRTPKGAERLLNGENAPQLDALIAACTHFDEVWEAMRELCGRANERSDAERILDDLRARLASREE